MESVEVKDKTKTGDKKEGGKVAGSQRNSTAESTGRKSKPGKANKPGGKKSVSQKKKNVEA